MFVFIFTFLDTDGGSRLDRIISLEGGFLNFARIDSKSSSCVEVNSFYWIQIRENKKFGRLLQRQSVIIEGKTEKNNR